MATKHPKKAVNRTMKRCMDHLGLKLSLDHDVLCCVMSGDAGKHVPKSCESHGTLRADSS